MPYATIQNLTGLSWSVPRLNVVLPPNGAETVYLEDADGFLGDARITADIEAGRISVTISSSDPGGAVAASEVGLDTSGFVGNLSAADTDVQLMAATVDALVIPVVPDIKAGMVPAAAFGGGPPLTAPVVFTTPFPDALYSVSAVVENGGPYSGDDPEITAVANTGFVLVIAAPPVAMVNVRWTATRFYDP